jgi:hypothetical protein
VRSQSSSYTMSCENVKGKKGKKKLTSSWSSQQSADESNIPHELSIVLEIIVSELLDVRNSKARGGSDLRGGGSRLINQVVALQAVVVFDDKIIVVSKRH